MLALCPVGHGVSWQLGFMASTTHNWWQGFQGVCGGYRLLEFSATPSRSNSMGPGFLELWCACSYMQGLAGGACVVARLVVGTYTVMNAWAWSWANCGHMNSSVNLDCQHSISWLQGLVQACAWQQGPVIGVRAGLGIWASKGPWAISMHSCSYRNYPWTQVCQWSLWSDSGPVEYRYWATGVSCYSASLWQGLGYSSQLAAVVLNVSVHSCGCRG